MNFKKPPMGGGARGWMRNSPESKSICFHCCPRHWGKGALQAAHTDAPYKNCRQLPSATIFWNFFCIHFPDIISNLNNNKTSSWNKMSINFHIPQWTVDEVITNNMVTPWKTKRATYFIFSTDQYLKARQARFSTTGYVCYTQTRVVSRPAVEFDERKIKK